ncbi:MAG: PHP domain-containing protein [Bryobacteraceae bacterium]|nr:PHP domain-containing protein [Bryobacteraceae bacterium]
MIDLHTHTTESDGTFTPEELLSAAEEAGLAALAITDHDTFRGYDAAAAMGAGAVRLYCGIELSTRLHEPSLANGKSVHLLAYFLEQPAPPEFRDWLDDLNASRRDRNRRMAARLRELGLELTLEEAEALGKSVTGRPHFARLLVTKGYVRSIREAFDLYLDESAKGYVARDEPTTQEAIRRVVDAGGIASLAHPVRLGRRDLADEQQLIASLVDSGLTAIEAYHTDHNEERVAFYLDLANQLGVPVTGGSDFHGAHKPGVALGDARVPDEVLARLLG